MRTNTTTRWQGSRHRPHTTGLASRNADMKWTLLSTASKTSNNTHPSIQEWDPTKNKYGWRQLTDDASQRCVANR